jgi:pimeloyl-[acyl-carrier protein] methyl ester esterase
MTLNLTISGTGNSLVLFHGWGFDSQIWQPLLPALENHFKIYCVDLPGFGNSAGMDWVSFKNQLLAKLPSQFALLGWSLGGLFGMRLAMEESHRVSHLINVCTSPRFVEDYHWVGIRKTILDGFYTLLADNPAKTIAHFQSLQKYKPLFTPKTIPSQEALSLGLDVLYYWDLREALDKIKIPTCFLFGRLDAIVPFTTLNCMQTRYPNFQYILFRKSAHMPFLSEPLLFLETIIGFIL